MLCTVCGNDPATTLVWLNPDSLGVFDPSPDEVCDDCATRFTPATDPARQVAHCATML
jgi:hypothetical protein